MLRTLKVPAGITSWEGDDDRFTGGTITWTNGPNEGLTVNKIWRDEVTLFTPITSVALHMAYKEQRDPYMDWKELWDSIGDVQ